jgi:predicted nuclease of predicted toxin-antitoxin system
VPPSPTPPDLPEFFVDRSLGRHLLPDALREAGFTVHTLATVYGEECAQVVKDEVWLRLAGERDWVVLTKDDAIRRRPAELAMVKKHAVKVFCLRSGNLTGLEQRERFLSHIDRIVQRSRQPGPWIDGVYQHRVLRLWSPSGSAG